MRYTVQGGDSLWRIAWLQLGDPNRWPEIARLNELRNPDRLLLGQRLFMPVLGTRSISPIFHGAPTAARSKPYLTSGLAHPHNWAGAEIGGAGGAALGIETGPGAILTGAVGALIFGTAGYLGADWATKRMFGGK